MALTRQGKAPQVALLDLSETAQLRASFKAEASTILASSLDYETTLRNVAKLAVPKFADWCVVELAESSGQTRVAALEHAEPAKIEMARKVCELYAITPNARQGVPQVLRTGQAELYEEITDEFLTKTARDQQHLEMLRALGSTSIIVVPMTVHGRTLGAITFIRAESGKHYDSADLDTAVLLGQRAALAVDNSRVHRDLQRAVRVRDDLLAVASHDLRNLLSLVSLRAGLIAAGLAKDPGQEKLRKKADEIRTAVSRMERLTRDLIDVGSIDAGRLKIERKTENLGGLISQALEELEPLAASNSVRLEAAPPARGVAVLCDRERILQLLINVIGNALKFIPSGGSVSITSMREGAMVRVGVRDTGSGIDPADLPHVFDRYYQAGRKRAGSSGLGLFIAKGIVEAHGGRIWVESTSGNGSLFCFTIPASSREEESDTK